MLVLYVAVSLGFVTFPLTFQLAFSFKLIKLILIDRSTN